MDAFGYPFFWIETATGALIEGLPPKEHNELKLSDMDASMNRVLQESVCKGANAFAMKNGSVLIILAQNDRPFSDVISAVVYEPKKEKVVAASRELGTPEKIQMLGDQFYFLDTITPTDVPGTEAVIRDAAAYVLFTTS